MGKSRKELAAEYKKRPQKGGVFAVKNSTNGRRLIMAAADLAGSRNRFEFSQAMGSCSYKKLDEDYKKYGKCAFSFEVLEEIEMKEGQTEKQFGEEVEALYKMVLEGENPDKLY